MFTDLNSANWLEEFEEKKIKIILKEKKFQICYQVAKQFECDKDKWEISKQAIFSWYEWSNINDIREKSWEEKLLIAVEKFRRTP